MLRIDRIEIGYTVDTDNGPKRKLVTLPSLRKHCRPERIADLLDDLQVLREDVQDERDAGRGAMAPLRSVR